MLAAALSLSLATIDYSCRAQRVELVIGEIEKLAKFDLSVAQDLRDEVVIIDVRDVETDVLLEKIAFVLRADWREKDGVRTLERDGARRAKNDREDEAAIKQWIVGEYDAAFPDARKPVPREALEQLALDLSLVGSLGEREDEARMEWYVIDPLVRAVRPLLDAVDWSVVRRSWGAHAVFSSRPQAFESPLAQSAAQTAKQGIVKDFAAIRAVCEKRGVKTDSDWSTGQWRRAAEFSSSASSTLYLRTGLPYSSIGVTITDGKEWLTQGTGSRSGSKVPSAEALGFDPATIKDGSFYSAESKSLAEFVRNFGKPPDAALVNRLRDPLAHDPLSFFETDFVLALSAQLRANVVVAPSELDPITDFTRGVPNGSIRESLAPFLRQHETKFNGSWLVARPKILAGQEYAKLDRRALARMVKRLQDDGTLAIADVAEAFPPAPSFSYRLLLAYIVGAAPGFPINDDYDGAPMEFGSLYRAMSESERRNAATRGMLAKSLTGKAQDTFRFHLWPVIEAQVMHNADDPRDYHGWMHAVTSPPDDLTVRVKYQDFGRQGILRVYFEFSSREWSRHGEAGFSFPTGDSRPDTSYRSYTTYASIVGPPTK
jgi:hypothetical protein